MSRKVRQKPIELETDLTRLNGTYLENLMTLKEQDQNQLTLRIRRAIVSSAKAIELRASFAPGRRESDILLVKLRGRREHAHIIATHLLDIFPEIDIEVLKGFQQDNYYNFTLIVTQKLTEQEAIEKERRAKLISNVKKELENPNKLVIPPELLDTLFLENI